jgi:hypothetical protein
MNKAQIVFVSILAVAGVAGIANAQTTTTQSAPPKTQAAAASSGSTTSADVETWTKKQWNSAQKKWAKDKTKWSDCQKQSGDKHLDGRKSWSFLYTCMTS